MSAPNLAASDVDPSAFSKAGPWSAQARVTESASCLNHPIELAELRARLAHDRKAAPCCEIGRGRDISPSPRHPVSDVCT